jgi:hypothetical protein
LRPLALSAVIHATCRLGSESFVEMLKQKYLVLKERLEDCPQGKRLLSFREIRNLSEIIASFYGVEKETLF